MSLKSQICQLVALGMLATLASSQVYIGTSTSSSQYMNANGESKDANQSIAAGINLYIANNCTMQSIQVRFNKSTASADNPVKDETIAASSNYNDSQSPLIGGETYQVWIKKGNGNFVHCGTLYIRA